MNHILLLGAGFSRNWGGWLATEAFEYLLGSPLIDDGIRNLLWQHKTRGGFESALAELQEQKSKMGGGIIDERLSKFQSAIIQMFNEMDDSFSGIDFEFQNEIEYYTGKFLARFNAIFTLNQDLLIERHYLENGDLLSVSPKWDGCGLPGMKPNSSGSEHRYLGSVMPNPNPDQFKIAPRIQPYIKLHGSSNWFDADSNELLVLGGNKASIIDKFPILNGTMNSLKVTYYKQTHGL